MPLKVFDRLVTDQTPPEAVAKHCAQNGIEIMIARSGKVSGKDTGKESCKGSGEESGKE